MHLLMFALGFIVGGIAGIVSMCLVQINRVNYIQKEKEQDSDVK